VIELKTEERNNSNGNNKYAKQMMYKATAHYLLTSVQSPGRDNPPLTKSPQSHCVCLFVCLCLFVFSTSCRIVWNIPFDHLAHLSTLSSLCPFSPISGRLVQEAGSVQNYSATTKRLVCYQHCFSPKATTCNVLNMK